VQNAFLLEQTSQSMRSVFSPKVDGIIALHATAWGSPLNTAMIFSSISSLAPAVTQGNYSAANTVLNAWADIQQVCPMICTPKCMLPASDLPSPAY
jgi:KR domain